MSRLNILLTGYSIADEILSRSSSTAAKIGHDTIRYVAADFEIWTGVGKTGTKLTITTDFVLSAEDTKKTTDAGVPIYTKLAIVNGAYLGISLYITYKTCGDYTSIENIKEFAANILSPLTGTVSANTTYKIPEGERVYTCVIPKAFLAASSGGPFILTLTTEISGKETVLIPILITGSTTLPKSLVFTVYVDAVGNVYSDCIDVMMALTGERIHKKVIPGTTPAAAGGTVSVAHGLDNAKILNINGSFVSDTLVVPFGRIEPTGTRTACILPYINGANLDINASDTCTYLSKAFKCVIEYME